MFKKIIEIIKNRYYISGMKEVNYYETPKEDVIEVENENNTTFFEYVNSKNVLSMNSENNIFKHLISQELQDLIEDKNIAENIKKTKSNHIIPCAYLAQWTIYNKVNKGKSAPQQKIKINGETKTLKNYMKIDYSLIQKVENMLVGQDEKSKAISVNLEKPVLREHIEDLHNYKAMKDFELFYTKDNIKNTSKINVLFLYSKVDEKGFVNGKIKDIKKTISGERLASDLFIQHTAMYEARQELWKYINESQKKGLINILTTILKDYEETKSFEQYIKTLKALKNIFDLALIRGYKETNVNKAKEIEKNGYLDIKEFSKSSKESFQNIVKENQVYSMEHLEIIEKIFRSTTSSIMNSVATITNYMIDKQKENYLEEIEKIQSLGFNINQKEEIRKFLEDLLILIKNHDGEINKQMTALINSFFLIDLYKNKIKNLEASFIFYVPYKLSGSNLPFLKFFNFKMFAISPHLLMINGSEKSLKHIKLLKFLIGTLFIYVPYQILIHLKKEGHIIK